ncbi:CRISPR-associated endonuclease Cas3'' [Roseateles sp. GG27B]
MKNIPQFAAHHREFDGEWQSLESHLLGVGDLAAEFAAKLGLRDLGLLLGLLHDLGKYSQAFQAYLKSATGALNQDEDEDWVDAESLKGKVDHSTAGAQFAWRALSKGGQPEQIAAQVLALCIASHHSGLVDCVGASTANFGEDLFNRRMNKVQQKTHLDEVQRAGSPQILERCEQSLADAGSVAKLNELLGQIWRSSAGAQTGSPQVAQQQFGLLVRFLFQLFDRCRPRRHGRF